MWGLSFSGKQFTWANKWENGDFVQGRLDRFVGSLEWNILFPNAQVTNLGFYHSDYRSMKIMLGSS